MDISESNFTHIKDLNSGMADIIYVANYTDPFTNEEKKVVYKKVRNTKPILASVKKHSKISHPNVPKIYGIREMEDKLIIVMEYLNGHNLYDIFNRNPPKDKYNVYLIAKKILSVLVKCHKNGLIHNDIKPENIVIDNDYKLFVIDWDLTLQNGQKILYPSGTWIYFPPEKVKNDDIEAKTSIDIWCLGCLLYFICTGGNDIIPSNIHGTVAISFFLNHLSDDRISKLIDKNIREKYGDDLAEFIESMLRISPEKRPSALDLLKKCIITIRKNENIKQKYDSDILETACIEDNEDLLDILTLEAKQILIKTANLVLDRNIGYPEKAKYILNHFKYYPII